MISIKGVTRYAKDIVWQISRVNNLFLRVRSTMAAFQMSKRSELLTSCISRDKITIWTKLCVFFISCAEFTLEVPWKLKWLCLMTKKRYNMVEHEDWENQERHPKITSISSDIFFIFIFCNLFELFDFILFISIAFRKRLQWRKKRKLASLSENRSSQINFFRKEGWEKMQH